MSTSRPEITLDAQGWLVCRRLAAEFDLTTKTPAAARGSHGRLSFGIEVEVPWSSYFPGLWHQFRLNERPFGDLSRQEIEQLTMLCAKEEELLQPILAKTIDCGVPRGNDRYWEFALDPVHDTQILAEQVRLLTAAKALPRDRKHSLQITIGGLAPCRSLYYLAMLLELRYVDPERIRRGIFQSRSPIHTGWARKGRAGIHFKGSDDLKNGQGIGSEIRTLQLPQKDEDLSVLLATAEFGANAIARIAKGDRTSSDSRAWLAFEEAAKLALLAHGLPDKNWGKTDEYGVEDARQWLLFADLMTSIAQTLERHWLGDLPKKAKQPSLQLG